MAELHKPRIPRAEPGDGQSVMARAASTGRDFKPYVYGGGDEPPAVTAARLRHHAVNEQIARYHDAQNRAACEGCDV